MSNDNKKETGQGMSFLLHQHISKPENHHYIIDVGNSFQMLKEIMDNAPIEIDRDGLIINPFSSFDIKIEQWKLENKKTDYTDKK